MTIRHSLGEAHRLAATHVDKSQLDDLLALLCSVTLHLGTGSQPLVKMQFPWAYLKNYRPPGTVENLGMKICSGQRTPVRDNRGQPGTRKRQGSLARRQGPSFVLICRPP